jgi:hypothetical protein
MGTRLAGREVEKHDSEQLAEVARMADYLQARGVKIAVAGRQLGPQASLHERLYEGNEGNLPGAPHSDDRLVPRSA